MTDLLKTLLSLSLSGTLLILMIFLLKPLWKNRLSKQWQYYIWLIVIARLLIPFAPETNLVGTFFQLLEMNAPQAEQMISQALDVLVGTEQLPISNDTTIDNVPVSSNPPPMQNALTVSMSIFLVWIVVALIIFVRKITIYQGFSRYIKARQEPVDDIDILNRYGILLRKAGIKKSIELSINPLVSSPLLMGLFRPCIVLPDAALSDADFSYTVRHELAHYKRHDMFYKWLVQIVACIHWFNPFVYLMRREINRACELSCDEAVIQHLNAEEKAAYGDTLLNAMEAGGIDKDAFTAVTLSTHKSQLKERLSSIVRYREKSKFCKIVSVILTITICFGSAAAGAYAASDDISNNVSLSRDSKENDQDSIKTVLIRDETWYLISDESQLRAIGTGKYGLDKKYLQNADIQMSTVEWVPIGTQHNPFTGIFNGNGFEIKGLTMKDPNSKVIGLFGFADSASLYNITMRDFDLLSAGSNVSQKGISPILVYGNGTTKTYDNSVY